MWGRLADVLVIDPEKWREDLLTLILRVTLVLGVVVYVPSVSMAVKMGLVAVAIIDTVAVLVIAALFLFDRLPFRLRASALCLILYFLGIVLLVSVGPISQIYLFGFSIIATLLLGLRIGFYSSVLSTATLFFIGWLGHAAPEMSIPNFPRDIGGWGVITLNFALIVTALTLAVGAVLRAVEGALSREIAARTSLDQERKLLRTLIDVIPDVVYTKDREGKFVLSNPAALALTGHATADDLAGKTVRDIFPPAIAEPFHADDLQVLAGQSIFNREERSVDPTGALHWYLTIKIPLRDDYGKIRGLVGISRNITDRKNALEALRESEERFRTMADSAAVMVWVADPDGVCTYINRLWCEVTGQTVSEALGFGWLNVVHPDDRDRVEETFLQANAEQTPFRVEYQLRSTDGSYRWCIDSAAPRLRPDGTYLGYIGSVIDITERKNLEEQLRQSQKMEAVGQLAGGIAHDFNNLLTIITGYSELLLVMPESNDAVRSSVQAISDAADRAAGLTRQLLAFSRQTILQPKVLDLNQIVHETTSMLKRLIGEDIIFSTVLEPGLQRVRVDPGQLNQVLMNLAVNARDAMPRGGHLTIETTNVVLSPEYAELHLDCQPGPHVMLAMTDTGHGMSPEVIERIFEPFYTTKAVGKGTGLGLATVFGIVKQSGGCIHVYSEPGHGTTFKIYFPAVIEPVADNIVTPAEVVKRGNETILLVEDEAGVRQLALMTLQGHGYRVLLASDGKDALRVVHAHSGPIDLLLTDVVMPRLNGPDLAQLLHARSPQLKVLFMSGYTDDAVIRHGILQAEVAFIQKPFTPVALIRKVRQVLDGAPSPSAN